MSGLDIRNIEKQKWNFNDFKTWLSDLDANSDENEYFDLKESFYTNQRECRKDFASFANYEGGFIIFGIKDKSKEIKGVEKFDINLRISDILSPNCINPEIKWDPVKKFSFSINKNTRFIYIIKIEKTKPFWKRPHISDGVVYIRRKGKSEPIKSLTELRERFFQKNEFIPEDLIYIDETIRAFSECGFNVDVVDVFIIRFWTGIKHYIVSQTNGEAEKLSKEQKQLLSLYKEISDYIERAKREKSKASVSTGLPDSFNTDDKEMIKIHKKISEKLLIFKDKFGKYLRKYE